MMLTKYYPHCKQTKKECRCKMVANSKRKIPPKLKPIQTKEGQVYLVAQINPGAPRQGMPPNPLSLFGPNQKTSCMQPSSQPQQPTIMPPPTNSRSNASKPT